MNPSGAIRGCAAAIALSLPLLGSACGGAPLPPPSPAPVAKTAPPPAPSPAEAASPAREAPPGPGPAHEIRSPAPAWRELTSGVRLGVIQSRALPLVQIRVAIGGGKAADGDLTGAAAITGELAKSGGAAGMTSRDLVARLESLGATLSVETDLDQTVFELAVTRDAMADALALVGAVVRAPELDAVELGRVKKRAIEEAARRARADGPWAARMVAMNDLFTLPTERHPYAAHDATAKDLEALTIADCRAFQRRFYVPRNTLVVIAGDTTPDAAAAAAEKAFAGYRGGEAPALSFTDPNPPEGVKVTLVDRPKSAQSDIYIAMLGPERADASWPAMEVASQLLGRPVSGRLESELRDKQALADTTFAGLIELAHGPSVWMAYAATKAEKTGLVVEAMLAEIDRLGAATPSPREVDAAARYLRDATAIRLGRTGALANELVHLRGLGLPDDAGDERLRKIAGVTPEAAVRAASTYLRGGHAVIVVAGDAEIAGPMLARFGEVKIVDPSRSFERERTLPYDPGAELEVPRSHAP